jgi:integrase
VFINPHTHAQLRTIKRSFQTACRLAGLVDFRFHDLRHTAITWMVQAGRPDSEVMKVAGLTNWKTFLRYKNINAEIARRVARALDHYHADYQAENERVN